MDEIKVRDEDAVRFFLVVGCVSGAASSVLCSLTLAEMCVAGIKAAAWGSTGGAIALVCYMVLKFWEGKVEPDSQ